MSSRQFKIGIIGTHSTGKSSFLDGVADQLKSRGVTVARIGDVAIRARERGFPILTGHTEASTLWIMAETMRLEAEAALIADVVLVDRAVLDAIAYYKAALQMSRRIEGAALVRLVGIAASHCRAYDLLVATRVDPKLPVAAGRDPDLVYRAAVAEHVEELVAKHLPRAMRLDAENAAGLVAEACRLALTQLGRE